MAKELDIDSSVEQLFRMDHDTFSRESLEISSHVLNRLGGYSGLIGKFPFDRGDTNKALILLCLRIADVVGRTDPAMAESLRSAAIQIGAGSTYPGSKRPQGQLQDLVSSVRKIIEELPEDLKVEVGTSGQNLEESVARAAIPKIRVIVVFANPEGTGSLRLTREDRVIRQALQRGKAREHVTLEVRHAATVDDVRHALLDDSYEILHFSGHGDFHSLLFEDGEGKSVESPIKAIAALVAHHPSIKCVVLNACSSVASLNEPIADLTVGMETPVDDDAAIQFAQGFYDAIAAGKSCEYAANEGKIACETKGFALPLRILRR